MSQEHYDERIIARPFPRQIRRILPKQLGVVVFLTQKQEEPGTPLSQALPSQLPRSA
jgi:hypothetical protein